jgi:hypothetical protein
VPTITLTDPVTGTTVASGLVATNNTNLRALLNSGLDYVNLKGNPQLVAGEIPVWNGTQFNRSSVTNVGPTSLGSGTPDLSKVLAGDGVWRGGMTLISETILGSSQATIDITSIPATYKHLKIIASLRTDNAVTSIAANTRFNNDSAANYADNLMQATSTVGSTERNTVTTIDAVFAGMGTSAIASSFWDTEAIIPNYARTDRIKNIFATSSLPMALTTSLHGIRVAQGTWNSTAAINRITLALSSGNFIAGCIFQIYGIG